MDSRKAKLVSKADAPILYYADDGLTGIAGYKQQLVACESVKEGIMSLVAIYYVCSVDYDAKRKLFLHFLQYVLTGEVESDMSKKANQLIAQLKL